MPIRTMTWRWLHDCLVYLLHRWSTGHAVGLDLRFNPTKPICLTCGR